MCPYQKAVWSDMWWFLSAAQDNQVLAIKAMFVDSCLCEQMLGNVYMNNFPNSLFCVNEILQTVVKDKKKKKIPILIVASFAFKIIFSYKMIIR